MLVSCSGPLAKIQAVEAIIHSRYSVTTEEKSESYAYAGNNDLVSVSFRMLSDYFYKEDFELKKFYGVSIKAKGKKFCFEKGSKDFKFLFTPIFKSEVQSAIVEHAPAMDLFDPVRQQNEEDDYYIPDEMYESEDDET